MALKNNLHVYAGTSSNTMQTSDNYDSYEAGANAGDILSSKTMNTAVRASTLVAAALIDAVTYGQSADKISHRTSVDTVIDFIQKGITNIAKNTDVTHAKEATNVDAITNSDTGSNNHIKFTIGDNSFEKTINNVSNANRATNIDAITNNDTEANNHIKFTIGDKSFEKTINNVTHADTASYANDVAFNNEDDDDNARVWFRVGNGTYDKTVNNVANANSLTFTTSTTYSVAPSNGWATLPSGMTSGWYYVYSYNSTYTSEIDCHGLVYINLPSTGSKYTHIPTTIKVLGTNPQSSTQISAKLIWVSASYGTYRAYMYHGWGDTFGNGWTAWSGDKIYFTKVNLTGTP